MTITSEDTRSYHSGTGGVFDFATGFKFLADEDLLVVLQKASGIDYTQVLNTDYTVADAGEPAGGTVSMVVAPASGEFLSIIQAPTRTQGHDYVSGDDFPADSHEVGLDRVTVIAQRGHDLVVRTPNLYDGDVDGAGRYNAKSNRLVELADPVGTQDAVTKAYVDAEIAAAAIQAWVTDVPMANVGHYSDTLGQMQTTRDPYPAASEDLAATLQEEVLSLRYQLEEIVKAINNDSAARWYHDLESPGGTTLIEEQDVSSQEYITVSLPDYYSKYGHYTIVFHNLIPTIDDVGVEITFSDTDGAGWLAGGLYEYCYRQHVSTDGGTPVWGDGTGQNLITFDTAIPGGSMGASTNEGMHGKIDIFPGNPTAGGGHAMCDFSFNHSNGAVLGNFRGSGMVQNTAAPVDGVRFRNTGATPSWATGKVMVYGHRGIF